MTSVGRPNDAGAATERTDLAWRRTGLALLAVTVTVGRLGLEVLPPVLVLAPTVVAAGLAGWVVARARRARHPVTDGRGATFRVLSDGRPPALVAAVVAGSAVGELAAVLARATR